MYNCLKIKYFILLCSIFYKVFSCQGQIFNTELDAYQSTDSLLAVRNSFKLDPLQIVVGDVPILFEKYIAKHLSLEVGLGITRRNFLSPIFEYDLDNLSRKIKIKSLPSYKIAFRFYFDDNEELDGYYISPEFSYKTNRKDFLELDTVGNLTGNKYVDKRIYSDLKLIVGRQVLSYSSNFLLDYYLGFGYRQKQLQEVHQLQGKNQPYFYEQTAGKNLAFFIGIKLGFGF